MLRGFMKKLLLTTILFVLHSLLHAVREVFGLSKYFGENAEIPEYFLMILALAVLVFASKDVYEIGKTFGFKKNLKR